MKVILNRTNNAVWRYLTFLDRDDLGRNVVGNSCLQHNTEIKLATSYLSALCAAMRSVDGLSAPIIKSLVNNPVGVTHRDGKRNAEYETQSVTGSISDELLEKLGSFGLDVNGQRLPCTPCDVVLFHRTYLNTKQWDVRLMILFQVGNYFDICEGNNVYDESKVKAGPTNSLCLNVHLLPQRNTKHRHDYLLDFLQDKTQELAREAGGQLMQFRRVAATFPANRIFPKLNISRDIEGESWHIRIKDSWKGSIFGRQRYMARSHPELCELLRSKQVEKARTFSTLVRSYASTDWEKMRPCSFFGQDPGCRHNAADCKYAHGDNDVRSALTNFL